MMMQKTHAENVLVCMICIWTVTYSIIQLVDHCSGFRFWGFGVRAWGLGQPSRGLLVEVIHLGNPHILGEASFG